MLLLHIWRSFMPCFVFSQSLVLTDLLLVLVGGPFSSIVIIINNKLCQFYCIKLTFLFIKNHLPVHKFHTSF